MRKASGGQKGVRKVRTAGGSRYYGLPIGSPITADDIARAKARNGGAEAPAPERASAQTTKKVLDAPKPKEPNALQRLNRKVQTGRSKPSNAETEKTRADELTTTGTKGGTVRVGERVYDVPQGVSLHPSPTGGPNVYAISPDESVRILTSNGIVDLDDDMSEQIMDKIYPVTLSPEEKASVYRQKISDADLGGDSDAAEWVSAHKDWSPSYEKDKAASEARKVEADEFATRLNDDTQTPAQKAEIYAQQVKNADLAGDSAASAWLTTHEEWAPNFESDQKAKADRTAAKVKSLTDETQTPEEKGAVYLQQVSNADLAGDSDAAEWVQAHQDWKPSPEMAKEIIAQKRAAQKKAVQKPSSGQPVDDEPTSTPTTPKKQSTKAQQDWDMRADSDFGVEDERPDKGYGDDMSDEDLDFYSKPTKEGDRRTPSQRKYDHAADSDYGIDGRQQRPDEGQGDQAPEPRPAPPKPDAKPKAPVRDKGPADKTKPLGNGNWDVTSMGRSVSKPDAGEIAAMKASPYTSKHLDEQGNLTPERIAVHDAIIESFLDGLESQQNPTQFMNGGGPASGKGTMTKGKNAELTKYPAARTVNDEDPEGGFDEFTGDKPGALLIDPDAIKMQLPEVKEARSRQAAGEGTDDDTQWAGSSHEESSQLAKRMHRAALERGYNVIYDGTGNSSPNSVRGKVRGARDLGYRVEANYLYLEPQEGISRAKIRADRANRIVPADQITGTYAKLPEIFDTLKEEGLFDSVNLFDNNVAYGEPARLIGSGDGKGFTLHDPEAYQRYMSSRERTDFTRFEATANEVRTGFVRMEPEVTSLMTDMAASHNVELAGLNHRLKEPDSLARKLSELAADTGLSPEEVQNEVRDALRYTVRVPDESYVDTIKKMLAEFEDNGYEVNAKNAWKPGSDYMGVNVEVTDPATDKSFEVQFHTPESLRIKHDVNHPIYKKARTQGKKGTAMRKPLDDEMAANSAKIPVPEGIFDAQF